MLAHHRKPRLAGLEGQSGAKARIVVRTTNARIEHEVEWKVGTKVTLNEKLGVDLLLECPLMGIWSKKPSTPKRMSSSLCS